MRLISRIVIRTDQLYISHTFRHFLEELNSKAVYPFQVTKASLKSKSWTLIYKGSDFSKQGGAKF